MRSGRRQWPVIRELKQLDWQSLVQSEAFSNVMRLVHLAMRLDSFDEDRIRSELLKARRRAYENELTIQARRVGCPSRSGRLGNNESLTALNEDSKADAVSIVNTYNFDLAVAILNIRTEVPTANRNTYVRRLRDWEEKRNAWKSEQIALNTEATARVRAQQDFYRFNAIDAITGVDGIAVLSPGQAAEPICQGWINRGAVPLSEALNNPPPYHPNCPHVWQITPGEVEEFECEELWMGE